MAVRDWGAEIPAIYEEDTFTVLASLEPSEGWNYWQHLTDVRPDRVPDLNTVTDEQLNDERILKVLIAAALTARDCQLVERWAHKPCCTWVMGLAQYYDRALLPVVGLILANNELSPRGLRALLTIQDLHPYLVARLENTPWRYVAHAHLETINFLDRVVGFHGEPDAGSRSVWSYLASGRCNIEVLRRLVELCRPDYSFADGDRHPTIAELAEANYMSWVVDPTVATRIANEARGLAIEPLVADTLALRPLGRVPKARLVELVLFLHRMGQASHAFRYVSMYRLESPRFTWPTPIECLVRPIPAGQTARRQPWYPEFCDRIAVGTLRECLVISLKYEALSAICGRRLETFG